MTELKPCPFCGCTITRHSFLGSEEVFQWVHSSEGCFLSGEIIAIEENGEIQNGDGIAWNTRPRSEAEELLEWLGTDDYDLSFEPEAGRWEVWTVIVLGDTRVLGTGPTPLHALRVAREAMKDE